MTSHFRRVVLALPILILTAAAGAQQRDPLKGAPDRRADEGKGPFKTLVIRGVMLIDGTGAPPTRPDGRHRLGQPDLVDSRRRHAGLPLRQNRGPQADHEIDATGMYLMPGFVDMHVHAGGAPKNADAEYAYKLWLAHGVTTVRGVPLGRNAFTVSEKERSAKNEIVAPRIFNYQRPGQRLGPGRRRHAGEGARVGAVGGEANGIDGLKLGAERPRSMAALLDEAKKVGLRLDRAPAAGRRRADERDQGRAPRPRAPSRTSTATSNRC